MCTLNEKENYNITNDSLQIHTGIKHGKSSTKIFYVVNMLYR